MRSLSTKNLVVTLVCLWVMAAASADAGRTVTIAFTGDLLGNVMPGG